MYPRMVCIQLFSVNKKISESVRVMVHAGMSGCFLCFYLFVTGSSNVRSWVYHMCTPPQRSVCSRICGTSVQCSPLTSTFFKLAPQLSRGDSLSPVSYILYLSKVFSLNLTSSKVTLRVS